MIDVHVGDVVIGKGRPLTIISGPCVIESREHTLLCAEKLVEIVRSRDVQFIFKASYDKANRNSYESFRGPGIEKGLEILSEVRRMFRIPVLTDVHEVAEVAQVASVVDMLQIPAFLCRQTDLIVAVARAGKPINVKKGQFMAPWDMKHIINKARSVGNSQVVVCDRGATFGYNNLVSDMRSLGVMQTFGVPVEFDATHSVQLPGAGGGVSGGQREFVPLLARSAVAAGIQALFIETHTDPSAALSDSASIYDLAHLGDLLDTLIPIHDIVRKL